MMVALFATLGRAMTCLVFVLVAARLTFLTNCSDKASRVRSPVFTNHQ
jgi:hypothetical protein